MKTIVALCLIILSLAFIQCFDGVSGNGERGPTGGVEVVARLEKVATLRKAAAAAAIAMDTLHVLLHAPGEDSIIDQIPLSGNGQQTVSKTYSGLASKTWTLELDAKDQNGVTVYSDSSSFDVPIGGTVAVSRTLSAQYAQLRANFFPIRDSVTRVELLVDGLLEKDSSFAKQSLVGDTVSLTYDYLPAGDSGVSHQIQLDVYGDMYGVDMLLYRGSLPLVVYSGTDTAYSIPLYWVGSTTPPPGQASMTVILGAIGTITVDGGLVDTAAAGAGNAIPTYIYNISAYASSNSSNYYPVIDGANVAWQVENAGDIDIFLLRGGSFPVLTSGGMNAGGNNISGDNVVWHGWDGNDYEIFMFNGAGVYQLTDNAMDDMNPGVSNDNVVWRRYDGNDWEIFFYNGSIVSQITDNGGNDAQPQVSGNNVVWSGWDGNDDEIFLYDGSAVSRLTDNGTPDTDPRISGGNVVWAGHDGDDWEIFFYNGSAVSQFTQNDWDDFEVRIDGNRAVWTGYPGGITKIFLYDGASIRQFTNHSLEEWGPQISGGNVVWAGMVADGTSKIFFYNGAVVTQLSTGTAYDDEPQVSGSKVAWTAWNAAGTQSDVFLASDTIINFE